MGLFDFLRLRRPPAGDTTPSSDTTEHIFAVPLAARPLDVPEGKHSPTYVFYAFLFADSAEAAVAHLRRELRGEGLAFVELTGKVIVTSVPGWSAFVSHNFDWIQDALPTAEQLADAPRGIIYYTPKITQV